MPGHITGMFRIHDESSDPLLCGSTGAGFSVALGTVTTVSIESSSSLDIHVEYNGRTIDAPVTKTVIRKMAEDLGQTLSVHIDHESSLPIGVGYGASGAGALGTAIAFASLVEPDLDELSTAQYAHLAEVENHTGLGDVIAQTVGGLEVRTHPGAPGFGEVMNIQIDEHITVVLAGSTGLETSQVLTDSFYRERINKVGDQLVHEVASDPTLDTFSKNSRSFAESTGLMTARVRSALIDLDSKGLTRSSQVMLGDSLFCICAEEEVDTALEILSLYWHHSEVMVTTLSEQGGRLL